MQLRARGGLDPAAPMPVAGEVASNRVQPGDGLPVAVATEPADAAQDRRERLRRQLRRNGMVARLGGQEPLEIRRMAPKEHADCSGIAARLAQQLAIACLRGHHV
jgi:hypothetical protein